MHWETSDREVEISEGRFVTSRIVVEPMAISSRGKSLLTFNWCFMARCFKESMNGEKQMNEDIIYRVHRQTKCQSAKK